MINISTRLQITRSGISSKLFASCKNRFYHSAVHDHFNNPRNVGSLPKDDPRVGTAVVGKASCGDVVKLQLQMNEDGTIEDAKFKTFGCGSAIASSSLATEILKGATRKDAENLSNKHITNTLSLPPVKMHCSMLVEEAVKAALEDYDKKNKRL